MNAPAIAGTVTVRGRVNQNLYLPVGGREVHAVLELAATAPGRPAAGPAAAEVLVLDGSGSMARHGKRERAIAAGAAAVREIRDGVLFAVVVGDHTARVLWPPSGEPRPADERSRAAAIHALAELPAGGGTAIGAWLRLARDLTAGHPGTLRHVTLLTDGRDEHESPAELDAAIQDCVGVLHCDCRGIGVSVEPTELYTIAERLSGSLRLIVDDDHDLATDFREIMAGAMARHLDLELRLWTPAQATVRTLRQITPGIADLQPLASDTAAGVDSYQLGGWGTETRRYYLFIMVEPPTLPPAPATGPGGGAAGGAGRAAGRARLGGRARSATGRAGAGPELPPTRAGRHHLRPRPRPGAGPVDRRPGRRAGRRRAGGRGAREPPPRPRPAPGPRRVARRRPRAGQLHPVRRAQPGRRAGRHPAPRADGPDLRRGQRHLHPGPAGRAGDVRGEHPDPDAGRWRSALRPMPRYPAGRSPRDTDYCAVCGCVLAPAECRLGVWTTVPLCQDA